MPLLAPEATQYLDVPLLRPDTVPAGSTVAIAIVPRGTRPVTADFRAAAWGECGGHPAASILVGPGVGAALSLTAGNYDVWLRVDASPESAWLHAGTLMVG